MEQKLILLLMLLLNGFKSFFEVLILIEDQLQQEQPEQ